MNYPAFLVISSACLCVSYILFILLRKEIWFLQQRILIITSVIFSLFLPLTDIKLPFAGSMGEVTSDYQFQLSAGLSEKSTVGSAGFGRIPDIISKLYLAVLCVCIMAIIFQIARILWLFITSEKSVIGNLTVLRNGRIKTPFSFFRWIFLPSALKDEEETRSIFIHESIHAHQHHSIDNLILEMACAILWFNPFIWIMKKSMHLVHEYLADEGTLKKGIEKTSYQALLVNQAAESKLISIPSGFNNNLLKKRMIMMTKTTMKDSGNARILSIIPLPVLLLLAVSIVNGFLPAELKAQKQNDKNDKMKEVVVIGYGNQKRDTGKTGKDTVNYIVDGVRVNDINSINPDSIESVNVLKEDNTVIIRTKGFSRSSLKTKKIDFRSLNGPEKILYILDEKEISEDDLKSFPPENIESISVLKHEAGIKKYTTKDYDGVIIVTSKK